jgi:hypothetical protein
MPCDASGVASCCHGKQDGLPVLNVLCVTTNQQRPLLLLNSLIHSIDSTGEKGVLQKTYPPSIDLVSKTYTYRLSARLEIDSKNKKQKSFRSLVRMRMIFYVIELEYHLRHSDGLPQHAVVPANVVSRIRDIGQTCPVFHSDWSQNAWVAVVMTVEKDNKEHQEREAVGAN